MIKKETEITKVERIHTVSVICDVCKKEITPDDTYEWQEIHFVAFTGGFGSVFGDDTTVQCEICQHCLKKLIGQYCRYD